jgi:AcrR family transcriptional regulator
MEDPHVARGRPRQPETDEQLMRATVELLRDKGPAGVTIEAVSARSGVARTTIYRRFSSRRELIAAAIEEVVDQPLPPGDLSLDDKVRWVLDQVRDLLDERLGRGTVAAIIVDADPEFTGDLRLSLERRLEALRTLMQSDVEAGRLAPHVEPDALVGLLFGAYLGEVLRHGQPRKGWTAQTVSLLLRALEVGPDEP